MTDATAFEDLAAAVVTEVPNLRVTGGSGDQGRDAVGGWLQTDDEEIICTVSLRKTWRTKIGEDIRRLAETGARPKYLVAVTNRKTSPAAIRSLEELARKLLGAGLTVIDQRTLVSRLDKPENLDARERFLGLPRPRPPLFVAVASFEDSLVMPGDAVNADFVGRADELRSLEKQLSARRTVLIEGPGGIGKSRFAAAAAVRIPELGEWFFCPDGLPFHPEALAELGAAGEAVVVVDNAHRRGDLRALLAALAQRQPLPRLLLLSRPGFREQLEAALEGLPWAREPEWVTLPTLTRKQVAEMLRGEPYLIEAEGLLTAIVRISEGNPQIAAIAAQLSRQGLDPTAIARGELFEGYARSMIRTATQGDRQAVEVLAATAALGELDRDRDGEAIRAVIGIQPAAWRRVIADLADAGQLVERQGLVQIKPDLLSDAVLRVSCFGERPALHFADLYAALDPAARARMTAAFGRSGLDSAQPDVASVIERLRETLLDFEQTPPSAAAAMAKALAPTAPGLTLDVARALLAPGQSMSSSQRAAALRDGMTALNRVGDLAAAWPLILGLAEQAKCSDSEAPLIAFREIIGTIWHRLPMQMGLDEAAVLAGAQLALADGTREYWEITGGSGSAAWTAGQATRVLLRGGFEQHSPSPEDEFTIHLRGYGLPASEATRQSLEIGARIFVESFFCLNPAEQFEQLREGLRNISDTAGGYKPGIGPDPSEAMQALARDVLTELIEKPLVERAADLNPAVFAALAQHLDLRRSRDPSAAALEPTAEQRKYLDLVNPLHDYFGERSLHRGGAWSGDVASEYGRRWAELTPEGLEQELARLAQLGQVAQEVTGQSLWMPTLGLALGDLAERNPTLAEGVLRGALADDNAFLLGRTTALMEQLLGNTPREQILEWLALAGECGVAALASLLPLLRRSDQPWLVDLLLGTEHPPRRALWLGLWRSDVWDGPRLRRLIELLPEGDMGEVSIVIEHVREGLKRGRARGISHENRAALRRAVLATATAVDDDRARDHSDAEMLIGALALGVDCRIEWLRARLEFALSCEDDALAYSPWASSAVGEVIREWRKDEEWEPELARWSEVFEREDLRYGVAESLADVLNWLAGDSELLDQTMVHLVSRGGLAKAAQLLDHSVDDGLFRRRGARLLQASSRSDVAETVMHSGMATSWSGSGAERLATQRARFEPWLESTQPRLRAFAESVTARFRLAEAEADAGYLERREGWA